MRFRRVRWGWLPQLEMLPRQVAKSAAILILSYGIAVYMHHLSTIKNTTVGVGLGLILVHAVLSYFLQTKPFHDRSMGAVRAAAERRAASQQLARRQEFEGRLHRALEMSDQEPEALDVVGRSLAAASSIHPSELLLADSSQAHLDQVASYLGGPGCGVASPAACPAVRRGQTSVFLSGDDLDACPHLRGRPGGDRSAAGVPVTILGNTVGVLHATGEPGTPPSGDAVAALEVIATEAGARIGMIRALSRSQVQAATDPLTGLLNRRSLEDAARTALTNGRHYALVMADLDHFKLLNDTYGHDAGDRALRLFSGVIKRALRPIDLACRYGGEEFVLVLPDCDAAEAQLIADRLREELALALVNGTTPGFTSSFGVADSRIHGDDLFSMIGIADVALLDAKRSGRDRVVLAA
jgi:diguanylate cyclase (GGDEF)-like protein